MIHLDFNAKITKFYPYEAIYLSDRLFSIKDESTYNMFKLLIKNMLDIDLKDHEYKGFGKYDGWEGISWDNKITIEILSKNNKKLYLQFYDGALHIGLSIYERNAIPDVDYIGILYYSKAK